jgi:hypothetical protein
MVSPMVTTAGRCPVTVSRGLVLVDLIDALR